MSKKELPITPITPRELNNLLDELVECPEYYAKMGDITIHYVGVSDDEERELFYMERNIDI